MLKLVQVEVEMKRPEIFGGEFNVSEFLIRTGELPFERCCTGR